MALQVNLSSYIAVILVCVISVYGFPKLSLKYEELFPYYPREAWNAAALTSSVLPLKTPVPYVVIHHTAIPGACHTNEQCSADMRSMQRYHQSIGWGDIGYNFCVGGDGGAYEGRGWNIVGVHTGRANNFSIGICLIGDWRVEAPPQQQLQTTKALIELGVQNDIISPDYKLIGHKQVMATECPGDALTDIISNWDHFSGGLHNFNANVGN